MSNFGIWQSTFDDLREKQNLHAGAVGRARADHEAAVRTGDIDAIVRSNETLRDNRARLIVITDLLERHKATRDVALAADRKAELAELVAEHEPLRDEGLQALERVMNALETFDAEVARFASIVTKVQNSARQCGQLPAIRVTLGQQNQLALLHTTRAKFFDAVMRASSSQS